MKEITNKRVFISYRRKGGIDTARWIHDQLKARNYNVFLDMESLRTGAFDKNLRREIKNSDIFLIVLTKGSLKRCIWKSDWVRQEIACALQNGVPVIPIMKEDFVFPDRLPCDIAPIRTQQGLKISYDFFDAFMEKLEDYICCAPEKPVHYDLPKTADVSDWHRYALGAVSVLGAIFTVFALARGCHVDQKSPFTTDPPVQTTTESTEAEELSVQILGNVSGNQCNGGVAAADGKMDGTVFSWKYISSIDHWKYWYDESTATVKARCGEDESIDVMTVQDLDYMLVTTDYLYYSQANGTRALYRMQRPEGKADPQTAECLIDGISTHNQIVIDEGFVYYWKGGVGLFRYSIADRTNEQILEHESTMDIDTMGMFNGWIYLYTENEIRRLKPATKELETIFCLDESFGDFKIAAGNAGEEWIYFAVTDQEKSGYTHADRIYRIYVDGSSLQLLFVKDSIGCKITNIALSGSDDLYVTMKCADGYCGYSIRKDTGYFGGSVHRHPEGFPHVVGINDGNTVTNLCNEAFTAAQSSKSTVYLSVPNLVYYNWLAVDDTSYYYDASKKEIVTMWQSGGDRLRITLKKNVTCHYLYVTPDWLFCALEENNVTTLYRAMNDPENHRIGELEVIDSDIIADSNRIAVYDGWIYYWKRDEGLYNARIEGGYSQLLYSKGSASSCMNWKSFYVNEDDLFFFIRDAGIYAVSRSDGNRRQLLDCGDNAGLIQMAVSSGEKIYYVVQHITDGVRTAPDEIWSMNLDGSENTVIHTVESIDQEICNINIDGKELYIKMLVTGHEMIFKLPFNGGELKFLRSLS